MSSKRHFRSMSGVGRLLVIVPVVMLLVLAGIGVMLAHNSASASTSAAGASDATATFNPIQHHESRNYTMAGSYYDLKKLKHDADAVVIGVVVGSAGTGMQTEARTFGYTDWQVQLVTVVFDRYHLLALNGKNTVSTIVIRQRGGVVNGTAYVDDNDPLMQVGSRALFFLHAGPLAAYSTPETTTSVASAYSVVGDAMGRFQIDNGKISGNVFKTIQFAQPESEIDMIAEVQALPE